MIKIMKDGKILLAEVRLVDGKLDVKEMRKDMPVTGIIEHLDELKTLMLTDEEIYRMMPHRLTSRIAAVPVGSDAKELMDPSFYDAVVKRAHEKMMGRSK